SERAARRRPNFVDEVRAAALALAHLGDDARLLDGAGLVAAHDAEAIRTNPLERLLLPLDADAELRQTQTPAFDLARRALRLHARNVRQTRVAVEAVRVGDEGPERLRACAQVVLPTVVKLSLRHFLWSVAGAYSFRVLGVESTTFLRHALITSRRRAADSARRKPDREGGRTRKAKG